MMRISAAGLELIKTWEGLELQAYRDIAGVWTIGYGHTEGFKDGRFNQDSVIDESTADALLLMDLIIRETAVLALVQTPLTQNEFDALVSLVYNIGVGAFKRSTVLRRLKAGHLSGAAAAFAMWNKATINGAPVTVSGLTKRRTAERQLFLTPIIAGPAAAHNDGGADVLRSDFTLV